MSGHGFHVHGPHDHELEHAASGGHDHGDAASSGKGMSTTGKIAVSTAAIATAGAIFAYMGGATQANAGLYKNNAAIKKTEIQAAAKKLEEEASRWDAQSETQMHQHHRWAQATTVLQVSIALAAIALLTRKKWLERTMYGVAVAGVAIGALAALHI